MEKISRREYLKVTAVLGAVAGAGLVTSTMPGSETLLKEVTAEEAEKLRAEEEQERTFVMGLHLCGFGAGGDPCAVDVKNGRIIRVRPLHYDWKYKPEELKLPAIKARGKIFTFPLKSLPSYFALSYKKRCYNPNRVRYPLKRVDFDPKAPPDKRNQQNRGKSGFVRISWDEALDIIEREIKRIKDTYGLYSCLMFSDGHGQSGSTQAIHGYGHYLFPIIGGGVTVAARNPDSWEGWYYGVRHVWGFVGPWGLPPVEYLMEDVMENTELMVSNADFETTPCGFAGHGATIFMFWFREAGKRMIWITPELNYTAAAHLYWVNGGKWIPILPNTDAALYLAIAYVWITEGTYDKDYIATHTYGFEDFKKYVLGEEDGVPKTPKWAEPITGVPARIIKALARLWASKRTSCVNNFGGAKIRGPYASEPARLEACLLAMQGIGKPGVQMVYHLGMVDPSFMNMDPDKLPLVGRFIPPQALPAGVLVQGPPGAYGEITANFMPKTIVPDGVLNPPVTWYGSAAFGAPPEDQFVKYRFPPEGYPEIHMIWNENGCLSACWVTGNKFVEIFRSPKIEFYVALGVELANDLLFADLVLPNTTTFEHADFDTGYFRSPVLTHYYYERAIEPIGESKSLWEIYCMLAERFGVLDEFTGGKSAEDMIKEFYEKRLLAAKYMSWDEFKKKQYFVTPYPTPEEWEEIKREKNLKPWMTKYWELPEGKGMGEPCFTPSGKIEFKSTNLTKYADLENYGVKFKDERPPVPHWIPYGEAYQARLFHPRAKKYPLLLQSNHPRWRHHVQMDDATWLREIPTCKIRGPDGYLYEPLWIHPVDAAKRGIKHGDIVKVYNDRGAVLGAAYVTERVSPNHVYMDHGARVDPIAYDEEGKVLLDRGGSINLLAPSVAKTYPLMCVSAYLVEVEKVDIFELMKQYPDAFKRKLHPDVGLYYESWVKG